jgi:hypothetical protein
MNMKAYHSSEDLLRAPVLSHLNPAIFFKICFILVCVLAVCLLRVFPGTPIHIS